MSALDAKTVAELKGLMGDAYETVYEAFARSARQCMEELAVAIEHSEIYKIERTAHTLKGSSANVGAQQLSHLCAEVVDMARSKQEQGYAELFEKIDAEYRRVEQAVAAVFGK